MQSPHFDAGTYPGAIYGPSSGFDTGAIKLHHSGYAGEPEAGCYSNYGAPGIQQVQGYNCRDTPAYSEAPSFFHSGFVSNFGNATYYKMPNRQMELTEYNNAGMVQRPQDNFLMKPQESLPLTASPNAYDNGNANVLVNSHDDRSSSILHHHQHQQHSSQQQQQHHHQHQHHHHHHQTHPGYDDSAQGIDTGKRLPDGSMYGQSSVKLEPVSSHADFNKALTSSASTTPSIPRGIHQLDIKSTNLTAAPACERLSDHEPSPKYDDIKGDGDHLQGVEACHGKLSPSKEVTDERKDDEVSGDAKPTMSYIALIAKAILESDQRRLNLGSIYNWIEKHYPFYKNKGQGWRNSVRHNLSLNDCFIKAGRCEDGKGNYWAIHPANIQDFMRGDFRQRRRSRRRGRKKECDLSMYHVPNSYLPSPATPLASGMTFNTAALSSIYSPYTEAERRAYRLDEALLRQSMNNPFVKWYQQGVSTPNYGVSTSPPACSTGMYSNPNPVQWPQAYGEATPQSMYPALNSTFPR